MRILHIFGGYGGGTSAFIANLASGAPAVGLTFDTLSFTDVPESFQQRIVATGGEVYRMENPKKQGWAAFRAGVETPLHTHRYDAIHLHLQGYRVLPFLWVARKEHLPVLIHAHGKVDYRVTGRKEEIYRWRDQWINRHLSAVPVGCGDQAIADVYGVPIKNAVVLPNAIDVARFLLSDEDAAAVRKRTRERLDIAPEVTLVGLIGRLVSIKNHHKLFDIAAYTKQKEIAAHYILAGAGEREMSLKEEVKRRDLEDVVTFAGRVEALEALYSALDVLLLPSFSEGFPTVVVEAQAARVPSVLSDTITRNVDLGLGLVQYEALTAEPCVWWEDILHAQRVPRPSSEAVREAFEDHALTTQQAALRYIALVENVCSLKAGEGRS